MLHDRAAPGATEITLASSEHSTVALRAARIIRAAPTGETWVEIEGRPEAARRAASCLLEPAAGDDVLIALARGENYILAILGRTGSAAASLSVDVPSEQLVLRGGDITVSGQRELRLEASMLAARARSFTVVSEAMSFVGQIMTQALDRFRSSARSVEIVSTDIATKSVRRTSLIEESDVLQAGTLVQTIATAAVTSTQSAVIAAEQDLRLDAERVTVG
jgi:hypothetical protein